MELKLLNARDVIMAFMKATKFSTEEQRQVLQMCNDELTAWEKRSMLVEIQKESEDDGEDID